MNYYHPNTEAKFRRNTHAATTWAVSKTRWCPTCQRRRSIRQWRSDAAKSCVRCE